MRGRRARDRDAEIAHAAVRAEIRNALSDGTRWSVLQMLGEEPPPTSKSGGNDIAALGAHEQAAAERREAKALDDADGWATELDAEFQMDDIDVPMLDEVCP